MKVLLALLTLSLSANSIAADCNKADYQVNRQLKGAKLSAAKQFYLLVMPIFVFDKEAYNTANEALQMNIGLLGNANSRMNELNRLKDFVLRESDVFDRASGASELIKQRAKLWFMCVPAMYEQMISIGMCGYPSNRSTVYDFSALFGRPNAANTSSNPSELANMSNRCEKYLRQNY